MSTKKNLITRPLREIKWAKGGISYAIDVDGYPVPFWTEYFGSYSAIDKLWKETKVGTPITFFNGGIKIGSRFFFGLIYNLENLVIRREEIFISQEGWQPASFANNLS